MIFGENDIFTEWPVDTERGPALDKVAAPLRAQTEDVMEEVLTTVGESFALMHRGTGCSAKALGQMVMIQISSLLENPLAIIDGLEPPLQCGDDALDRGLFRNLTQIKKPSVRPLYDRLLAFQEQAILEDDALGMANPIAFLPPYEDDPS